MTTEELNDFVLRVTNSKIELPNSGDLVEAEFQDRLLNQIKN